MKITLSHGSGGRSTTTLIESVFKKYFSNPILNMMEDSAVVEGNSRIAMTTDSFVVTPIIFNGGDIGRLSICGTVNDLLMRGATPKYITCGFIIEEGLDLDVLETVVKSMADTANEAGVIIVAGDTKVIEGNGSLCINTSGVGFVKESTDIVSTNIKEGDIVLINGNIGDHHATILSHRMNIENDIRSDNAPLCDVVKNLLKNGIEIHAMRDVTRGGLATVLNELADASHVNIELKEDDIPISDEVRAFSKILGLNVMHMGNEGKFVVLVPAYQKELALDIMKKSKYSFDSAIIGEVKHGRGVSLITKLGGNKIVSVLVGEGLPRIC